SRYPGQQVGGEVDEALLEPGRARMGVGGQASQVLELGGRVLERLALQQAGEEQVALLEQQQLVVEVEVVAARQQAAGLELDERGGDEEELGGHLEIEMVHALELGQVAVDDAGQRDLVDVDLLARDQVQEQVEGPFEDRGLDLVRHVAEPTGPPPGD